MAITNGRRKLDREKDGQRHSQDVSAGLGCIKGESVTVGTKSNTVLCSDSERANQIGTRSTTGGQKTPGGIYRRLKELHEDCLELIESHQTHLEHSLHKSKQLTAEIQDLEKLLSEVLSDTSEKE